MVRSNAETVEEYLDELPPDRREAIEAVREVVLANLPDGMVETMNWGMISYEVPLEIEPDTYNGKPLMYAALANQKNHMAIYLTAVYADGGSQGDFRAAWEATGKKLDMGKSCVRFSRLDDVALDVLGEAIGSVSTEEFCARVTHQTGRA